MILSDGFDIIEVAALTLMGLAIALWVVVLLRYYGGGGSTTGS
jgi:ABC-type transporter Mla subunit MlaD